MEVDHDLFSVWQYVSHLPTASRSLQERPAQQTWRLALISKIAGDVSSFHTPVSAKKRERKALLQGRSQRLSSRISYYRDIGAVIDLGHDGNSHPPYFKTPTWY